MHDYIPLILFLYALSSAPDGRIIDILHLRDLYESEPGHVVIQSFSFRNGQSHLMNDGIDLGVVFNLVLGLKVDGSVSRRAFFDANRFVNGQLLLLDVPQSMTVAGESDSQ